MDRCDRDEMPAGAPRPRPDAGGPPRISVIVPVLNEAGHIRRVVGDLLDQDYDRDRFEVLVVDGGSTDGTREIVRELADPLGNVSDSLHRGWRRGHRRGQWQSPAYRPSRCRNRRTPTGSLQAEKAVLALTPTPLPISGEGQCGE